ncbi:MAG: hypothetical protein P8X98_15305, partial [Woeseiaceae bacterium]
MRDDDAAGRSRHQLVGLFLGPLLAAFIVVDVFMTHLLRIALASMKPPISDRPLPPTCCRTVSAMRRCR